MQLPRSLITVLLTSFFGLVALATPTNYLVHQPGISQQCKDSASGKVQFKNTRDKFYYAKPELVTATACESPCSITKEYTWSKGTTVSLDGSIGGDLLLNKVWEFFASSSISAGVAWTTEKGETTSTSLECPFDVKGIKCGVQAEVRMVKITGKTRRDWSGSPACNGVPKGWKSFKIHAPATKKTWSHMDSGKDGADDIDVTFSACLAGCDSKATCKKAKDKKFKLCPKTEVPKHWDGPLTEITDMPLFKAFKSQASKIVSKLKKEEQ